MIIHKCIIYVFGDSCTHLQTWIGTHRLRCSCKTLHTHLQIPTATIIASISPPRHQGANHRPHYHSIHYGLYYDSIHYWPYYNSTHYRPDNHSTHHGLYYHSTHCRLYWWDTPFSWVDWRIRWGIRIKWSKHTKPPPVVEVTMIALLPQQHRGRTPSSFYSFTHRSQQGESQVSICLIYLTAGNISFQWFFNLGPWPECLCVVAHLRSTIFPAIAASPGAHFTVICGFLRKRCST